MSMSVSYQMLWHLGIHAGIFMVSVNILLDVRLFIFSVKMYRKHVCWLWNLTKVLGEGDG